MVTEITRYLAADGKEFTTYHDAVTWEMRCKLVNVLLKNTALAEDDARVAVDYLLLCGVINAVAVGKLK